MSDIVPESAASLIGCGLALIAIFAIIGAGAIAALIVVGVASLL